MSIFKPLLWPAAIILLQACASSPEKEKEDSTATVTASPKPVPYGTAATSIILRNVLAGKYLKNDLTLLDTADRKFIFDEYDLDGDGDNEIFVGFRGPYFCGNAGCTAFLLNADGSQIAHFTVVQTPILIATDKTNGWYNLVIESRGKKYTVKYDGERYPSNPSVQPLFKGILPADAPRMLDEQGAAHEWIRF